MLGTERVAATIRSIGKTRLARWIGNPALPLKEIAQDQHRVSMPSEREVPQDRGGITVTVSVDDIPVSLPKCLKILHDRFMPPATGRCNYAYKPCL